MEKTEYEHITASIKSSVDSLGSRLGAIQSQVDAIDSKITGSHGAPFSSRKSLTDHLKESDQFSRLLQDRRGTARLTLSGADAASAIAQKTTITSAGVGWQTTGVLAIERTPGIVQEPRQALTIRSVLSSRPTQFQVVDYVRVSVPMSIASPQPETQTKAENAVQFTSSSERIKTIASWIPATRQILDDWTELGGFLQTSLSYYVNLEEELQILLGDGVGENLRGIIPQAALFNAGSLVPASGWTKIDIIGRAIQQLTVAKEIPPSFCVLSPADWWSIRLTKDSLGRYLIGDPQTTATARLFDLDVVSTTSVPAGTFLVGSGAPEAVEIRDRMELQYEISTEHSDFFARNLVACRAERRLALVLKRPGSFVTGSLTSSPVS
jgi:HK97 family phage major capsid protein